MFDIYRDFIIMHTLHNMNIHLLRLVSKFLLDLNNEHLFVFVC